MSKKLGVAVIIAILSFFLVGCGGTVDVGPLGCAKMPNGKRDCGIGPRVTFQMRSLPGEYRSTFDASLLSVDLSSSNVPVDSTTGYATVTAKLDNSVNVANSFQWVRVGDIVEVANPSAVNSWLTQYLDELESVKVDFNFITESMIGPNLVVVELNYGGAFQGGASTSWYGHQADCTIGHCQVN